MIYDYHKSKYHPAGYVPNKPRKQHSHLKIIVITTFVLYVAISAYNGYAETVSQESVNISAQGVLRYAWFYFTNPDVNFDIFFQEVEKGYNSITQGLQSTDMMSIQIETDVHHSYYNMPGESEYYVSTINYSFDTSFLISNGIEKGDTYKTTVSFRYENNAGDIITTESFTSPVIIGERAYFETTLEDPTGYVLVEDIVGFNIK